MIKILGLAAPAWLWWLVAAAVLAIAAAVAYVVRDWTRYERAQAEQLEAELARQWAQEALEGPAGILAADLRRLVNDDEWAAEMDAIALEAEQIDAWLARGMSGPLPWALVRLS